ncbi:fatty acid desaturase [Prochlorococcus sp. MIT 1341]|uniref:fatty acid desaturase n=1 Tax=Prochlorococcus sp. MIT 1341 TaxID=3096221 RepID=UPI002A762470|nr:fatty acid desaturase [Prochlorococcus sp. MIT 1341]
MATRQNITKRKLISSPAKQTKTKALGRPLRRSDFAISPFLVRSNSRALWQVLSTLGPIILLWVMIGWITEASLPLPVKVTALFPILGLLVLLSSRSFSLMHDCGHDSLFKSRWLNRITGFLLGVLNAIPQHPWSRGHAFHHKHNGNWQLYRGPSAVITLKEYQSLSKLNKNIYAISRHPLMLFPGGFFYLIIKPRGTLFLGILEFIKENTLQLVSDIKINGIKGIYLIPNRIASHKSSFWYTSGELADLIGNNFLVIATWLLMSNWLGAGFFWTYYSIVMTISAAIFICVFFVQHNFENSYAHSTDDWSYIKGATEGSSNLEVPRWLNWFFADISFHSIHHICERIPNYNLRECNMYNKDLLADSKKLSLSEISNCFKYILWDESSQELTTIQNANIS